MLVAQSQHNDRRRPAQRLLFGVKLQLKSARLARLFGYPQKRRHGSSEWTFANLFMHMELAESFNVRIII
jgi:hypothetical protein